MVAVGHSTIRLWKGLLKVKVKWLFTSLILYPVYLVSLAIGLLGLAVLGVLGFPWVAVQIYTFMSDLSASVKRAKLNRGKS